MRTTAKAPTASRRQWVPLLAAILLALIPVVMKVVLFPAYPGSDDAFIHIAVARHILAGDGWGITLGENVNMSSSPVFTVLLLPILGVASIGLAQAVSLLCAFAALVMSYLAVHRFTGSAWAGFAAVVVGAANAHLWRWSGTVMETSLAYLAVVAIAAATLACTRADRLVPWQMAGLGMLIGVATQVRFEIGIFLPLSTIVLWFAFGSGRRSVILLPIAFAVSIVPWCVFAWVYFGSPIPTTFYAKASGFHIVNTAIVKQLGTVVASGIGISIIAAMAALLVIARCLKARQRLRAATLPLVFLAAWPIILFVFYYIKTNGLESAARYYLPGMATWPLIVGYIVAALPRTRNHVGAVAATLVASLAFAFVVTQVQVRPVLTAFNGAYRVTMSDGAAYLREICEPGDIALVKSDIGIMAEKGIGPCTLADAGALASPELRGLNVDQKVVRSHATYVVQSISKRRDEWADNPLLRPLRSWGYTSHGVSRAGEQEYLNIYAVR